MTDYTPQVITAPTVPGQVRKVGHLEIPANRFERIGPDPLPPLNVAVVEIERTPEGRLLCYRHNGRRAQGTGCAGCKWSCTTLCASRFDAAYQVETTKREAAMSPEELERYRAHKRAAWKRYRDAHRPENMPPEELAALRAKWRAKGRRGREARNARRLEAKALLSQR